MKQMVDKADSGIRAQLQTQTRKSGPQSKTQRAARLKEVHRLHIELGYSAVKISEMMNINRNTINADINLLYEQATEELQIHNSGVLILKQIQRLEMQQARLVEELENQHTFEQKMTIERLLFDINNKISQIATKIQRGPYRFPEKEIQVKKKKYDSKKVKEIIKKVSKNMQNTNTTRCARNEIEVELVRITKCSIDEARDYVDAMFDLGLGLCSTNNGIPIMGIDGEYNFEKFAKMYE